MGGGFTKEKAHGSYHKDFCLDFHFYLDFVLNIHTSVS